MRAQRTTLPASQEASLSVEPHSLIRRVRLRRPGSGRLDSMPRRVGLFCPLASRAPQQISQSVQNGSKTRLLTQRSTLEPSVDLALRRRGDHLATVVAL